MFLSHIRRHFNYHSTFALLGMCSKTLSSKVILTNQVHTQFKVQLHSSSQFMDWVVYISALAFITYFVIWYSNLWYFFEKVRAVCMALKGIFCYSKDKNPGSSLVDKSICLIKCK